MSVSAISETLPMFLYRRSLELLTSFDNQPTGFVRQPVTWVRGNESPAPRCLPGATSRRNPTERCVIMHAYRYHLWLRPEAQESVRESAHWHGMRRRSGARTCGPQRTCASIVPSQYLLDLHLHSGGTHVAASYGLSRIGCMMPVQTVDVNGDSERRRCAGRR